MEGGTDKPFAELTNVQRKRKRDKNEIDTEEPKAKIRKLEEPVEVNRPNVVLKVALAEQIPLTKLTAGPTLQQVEESVEVNKPTVENIIAEQFLVPKFTARPKSQIIPSRNTVPTCLIPHAMQVDSTAPSKSVTPVTSIGQNTAKDNLTYEASKDEEKKQLIRPAVLFTSRAQNTKLEDAKLPDFMEHPKH